jgi:aconitate hydratase
MALDRARTEVSVQYVDHNIIQEDNKNPDDHLFLFSAAQRFGIWFSRPGNGVSHPVHMESFGKPGKTLLGSDSHTPAAGSLGMLAIGAGGLEVALSIAGEPFYVKMPKIMGVKLTGQLPKWVSAKDVILEMLRRHSVKGGLGKIIEYYGPGLKNLSAMDRHVISNMGAELGATTTVFPSDFEVKRFLTTQGREQDWVEILADEGCTYDLYEEIDLSKLEPLVAKPTSPGNVVPVREIAGQPIYQAYVGSSANPGFRDFAMAAEIVKNKSVASRVSFDVAPTSRQILEKLVKSGHLGTLIHSGARIHQAGCNGCIGMGQAPATHENSLRTVPRNFPGRSGTKDDRVFLVSPETAAASALSGVITDPRTLNMEYPEIVEPASPGVATGMLVPPLALEAARKAKLQKGPNIAALPDTPPCPDHLNVPVILKLGDDISTDTIMPAGAKVLPYRSNIPKISEFAFYEADTTYYKRAMAIRDLGGHVVVAGENYGQGSSREHAALAPRYLGLHAVIAISFARIHWQNLVNFGVLPLTFKNPGDYESIVQNDFIEIRNIHEFLTRGQEITARNVTRRHVYELEHALSPRQLEIFLKGGLIPWMKKRLLGHSSQPDSEPSNVPRCTAPEQVSADGPTLS